MYQMAISTTYRMDYPAAIANNLAYCLAVEKLLEIEVPPRGQFIRVMMAELQRIASHLVWLGTQALDLGAMSVFLYCFREREVIMNLFEQICGARLTTSYIRIGGVAMDMPLGYEDEVAKFLSIFPSRIDEYEALLTENEIWRDRTMGVGILDADMAVAWGITGPALRAAGVNYDVRKTNPYWWYENFEF